MPVTRWTHCVLIIIILQLCGNTGGETLKAQDAGYPPKSGPKLVCYFTPTQRFPADRVPSEACSHLIYAFGSLSTSASEPNITAPSQGQRSAWTILTALRRENPSLKVLLSLQQGFPDVVGADLLKMQKFAVNAVNYLRKYGFDGVDMDWEFPSPSERDAYSKFLAIMRTTIDKEANATGKAALLLSLALPNSHAIAERSYDIPAIASSVDFATAMTYDFHVYSKGDNVTGYNSPLFTPGGDYPFYSASAMVLYYIKRGMPAHMLMMGIPTYGRSWTLARPDYHFLGAPALGKGPPSPVTHLKGVYTYPDACAALKKGAVSVPSTSLGAVYLYQGTTWVAYDDSNTVTAKCKWVMKEQVGGVGVWAMHLDDLNNECGQGSLPLIQIMNKIVLGGRPPLRGHSTDL
uniref:Chitinase-like lectin n=1 Tax=Littorina littorea TaxID=31216 RepID=A0A0A7RVU6_LITLI|nr:chitinase-like lectin [Littorina littorea]